jgi:hypothetical protein
MLKARARQSGFESPWAGIIDHLPDIVTVSSPSPYPITVLQQRELHPPARVFALAGSPLAGAAGDVRSQVFTHFDWLITGAFAMGLFLFSHFRSDR